MFFYTLLAGLPNLWCSLAKDFVLRSFWHGIDRGLSVFGAFSGLPRTPRKFCSLKPHFKSLSWQLRTALSGRASILPFGRICGCCWRAQWRLGGSLRILMINLIFALLGSSMLVNDGVVRPWEVQSCFCSMALLQMSCFFYRWLGGFFLSQSYLAVFTIFWENIESHSCTVSLTLVGNHQSTQH